MKTTTKPPTGLCKAAQKFWREILQEFAIDDAASLRLLASACESYCRMLQAGAVVEREGLTCVDGHGNPKPHPAVQIERDARSAMNVALKQLKLEVGEPQKTRQPGRQPGVPLLNIVRGKNR